jgi:ATP synthase protein I
MSDPKDVPRGPGPAFAAKVGQQATRKLMAARHPAPGVWFGLGMMGLVGWSVAVPTLAGTALGFWLDQHHPGRHPWTLALLVLGLALGCLNAWHWLAQQGKSMEEDQDE